MTTNELAVLIHLVALRGFGRARTSGAMFSERVVGA